MSRDFAEMLEAATPTAEVMEVDTSFLDAYRRGGSEELKRVQAQAAQPEPEVATPEPEAQLDEAGDVDSQPEVESLQADPDVDAEELVTDGKAGLLVRGFRGAPAADLAALVDLVHRLSRLGLELPAIAELDLNPGLALPDHCIAVDARVRIAQPAVSARTKTW